jgi:hypothetical protein
VKITLHLKKGWGDLMARGGRECGPLAGSKKGAMRQGKLERQGMESPLAFPKGTSLVDTCL